MQVSTLQMIFPACILLTVSHGWRNVVLVRFRFGRRRRRRRPPPRRCRPHRRRRRRRFVVVVFAVWMDRF